MEAAPNHIPIQKVMAWPDGEIADLYREGGWWKAQWDPSAIGALIRGSFVFLVAVDPATGSAIGMGRAISDGVSDAYLQDVVVHSTWRGRGIGTRLLTSLIEECRTAGIGWIACIAEPETVAFYTHLGFRRMEGHVPMLLREER
jgi:ribosomal protein S18 acetylase RimI-like enzyme